VPARKTDLASVTRWLNLYHLAQSTDNAEEKDVAMRRISEMEAAHVNIRVLSLEILRLLELGEVRAPKNADRPLDPASIWGLVNEAFAGSPLADRSRPFHERLAMAIQSGAKVMETFEGLFDVPLKAGQFFVGRPHLNGRDELEVQVRVLPGDAARLDVRKLLAQRVRQRLRDAVHAED